MAEQSDIDKWCQEAIQRIKKGKSLSQQLRHALYELWTTRPDKWMDKNFDTYYNSKLITFMSDCLEQAKKNLAHKAEPIQVGTDPCKSNDSPSKT